MYIGDVHQLKGVFMFTKYDILNPTTQCPECDFTKLFTIITESIDANNNIVLTKSIISSPHFIANSYSFDIIYDCFCENCGILFHPNSVIVNT